MMVKINARESVEIVKDVFVNVITDSGSQYISWDELTENQLNCFTGMSQGFQEVYNKYKGCMND